MNTKIIVTWDDVYFLCERITNEILKSRISFDISIPIIRGGIVPGIIISETLGIEKIEPILWQTRDGKEKEEDLFKEILKKYHRILIIDDIIDSGKTIYEISRLVENERSRIFVASLMKRKINQYDIPFKKFVGEEIETTSWVEFPWEFK